MTLVSSSASCATCRRRIASRAQRIRRASLRSSSSRSATDRRRRKSPVLHDRLVRSTATRTERSSPSSAFGWLGECQQDSGAEQDRRWFQTSTTLVAATSGRTRRSSSGLAAHVGGIGLRTPAPALRFGHRRTVPIVCLSEEMEGRRGWRFAHRHRSCCSCLAAAACDAASAAGRPATARRRPPFGPVVPVGTGYTPAAKDRMGRTAQRLTADHRRLQPHVVQRSHADVHDTTCDADLLAVTLAGTGQFALHKATFDAEALLSRLSAWSTFRLVSPEQPFVPGDDQPRPVRRRRPARRYRFPRIRDAAASSNIDAADLLASLASNARPVTIIALRPTDECSGRDRAPRRLARHVASIVTMDWACTVTLIRNTTNDTAR